MPIHGKKFGNLGGKICEKKAAYIAFGLMLSATHAFSSNSVMFIVTTPTDDGTQPVSFDYNTPGTYSGFDLRGAIHAGNASELHNIKIKFSENLSGQTIVLGHALPMVSNYSDQGPTAIRGGKKWTFKGPFDENVIIDGAHTKSNPGSRGFFLSPVPDAAKSGLPSTDINSKSLNKLTVKMSNITLQNTQALGGVGSTDSGGGMGGNATGIIGSPGGGGGLGGDGGGELGGGGGNGGGIGTKGDDSTLGHGGSWGGSGIGEIDPTLTSLPVFATGGTASHPSGGVGGGGYGDSPNGGDGGFGGGGGGVLFNLNGGDGGFGGGGGLADNLGNGVNGGSGGFGGAGGWGNVNGGNGGFAGGGGSANAGGNLGKGGFGASNGVVSLEDGGGGGAGLGGALFINKNTTVKLTNVDFRNNNAIGGEGFNEVGNGAGFGGSIFVRDGGKLIIKGNSSESCSRSSGSGKDRCTGTTQFGAALFIKGAQGFRSSCTSASPTTVTFDVNKCDTVTIGSSIGDDKGNKLPDAGYGESPETPSSGGAIRKKGPGKLILLGANTYSGGTVIKQGTLQIGCDAALGSGKLIFDPKKPHSATLRTTADITTCRRIILLGNGGTFDPGGNTLTLNGLLSGKGGLSLNNSKKTGKLVLGHKNTYKGPTRIKKGILQMGVAGALSKNTDVSVKHGARFDLNNFNQSISSLSGSGKVTLGCATLTLRYDDRPTTFSGHISGAGGLTKKGKGTVTFSGKNTYCGPTTIKAGTMNLTGSMNDSAVTVNKGAILEGTGSMHTLTVSEGGIIEPGDANKFGTLSVTGNSTTLDGTYLYKINAEGSHDLITDAGPVTLGVHSTLNIKPKGSPESYPNTETYTVLEGSSVTGSFGKTNFPVTFASTFKYNLSYNPEDVLLTLYRKANVMLDGVGGNAGSIIPAYDTLFSGEAALFGKALMSLPTRTDMINAIQLLGSPQNSMIAKAASAVKFELLDQILKRMRSPETGEKLLLTQGFRTLLNNATSAKSMISSFFKNQERSQLRDTLFGIQEQRQPLPDSFKISMGRTSLWIQENAGNIREKSFHKPGTRVGELRATAYGTQAGVDYQLNKCAVLGITAGYNHTHFHGAPYHGHIDSYNIGLYGDMDVQDWYLEGVALFTHNSIKEKRNIHLPGFIVSAKQHRPANEGSAMIETGYDFTLPGHVTLTPYINGAIVYIKDKSYREHNAGNLNLYVSSQDRTAIQGKVGGQISQLLVSGCLELYGYVKVAYTYRKSLKNGGHTRSSFVNQSTYFTVISDTKANNMVSPGVGLTALFKNGIYCTLSYNGDFGGREYDNMGFLRIGVRF